MTIDPSARVEAGAVIGAGASIGPYCIVGPNVVIGDNCRLIAHVHVMGQTSTRRRLHDLSLCFRSVPRRSRSNTRAN